ncbi:TetR/AcrR family transcriptional regulator [Myxococcota bacterium]|nr:TetR/AcrR family transcriptional regulator [Myxococcota bacterium]MBU1536672.1 TetR/AcrR family transcriptional regulator [Myxococcota bacterium]
MTPKIINREEKSREIALAALTVFAEHGFESTSMSQVAEAAGIGKGTIYEYFHSKTDLIIAATAAWVQNIEEGITPLLDSDMDPLTRLRTLFAASTKAFLDDPKVILVFLGISQLVIKDPALGQRFGGAEVISAPIRKVICSILADGVAAGLFHVHVLENSESIARNLVAFVDGIGLHYVTNPHAFDLAEQINFYLEQLIATLSVAPNGDRSPGVRGKRNR